MTTVAYNHKDGEIAVDSRETAGSLIATDNCNKIEVIRGEKYIGAGVSCDIELLTQIITNGAECNADIEANVMFTKKGKVYNSTFTVKDGLTVWEIKRNYTMGTGESFALASMDHGKSAKDAVKYAMTRDIYSGGRVRLIKVK